MQTALPQEKPNAEALAWKKIVAEFEIPSTPRALWQLANTLVPYLGLWGVMYWSRGVSWWITAPLAMLAGLFLVRIFIIFHDCGHGSFFKSRAANDALGFITGLLTLTPYFHWRWEHSVHHATSGHLDKRGTGDIWTMTVQEYLEATRWKRFAYRLSRSPIVLFVIAPLFLFLIWQRIPTARANKRERHSVHWMNFAVFVMAATLSLLFGLKSYLLIQLLITTVGGSVGVWMFYVQHQFEGAYWEHADEWDYTEAALQGSSFYKLPKILQWFTGNIGFHHIHHLSSRIPNYNLERCHEAHELFKGVKPVTMLSSLKSLTFHLWDDQRKKLVSFRQLRQQRREAKEAAAIHAAKAGLGSQSGARR